MTIRDANGWFADLGGGTRVALVVAGSFRSDAGVLLGHVPWTRWKPLVQDEIDDQNRLRQALNCLLVETPAGRVLVETGIGERLDEKANRVRGVEGRPILDAMRVARFDPLSVDFVALSHLHFDHAGGLLDVDGRRSFARARIVAQRAEWEIAFDDNPRIVAGYDQAELRLVHRFAETDSVDGERELMPGVTVKEVQRNYVLLSESGIVKRVELPVKNEAANASSIRISNEFETRAAESPVFRARTMPPSMNSKFNAH